MVDLFLLCGKPGCGKTTVSKFMQEKCKMVGFSADDFMLKLFGEVEDREEFERKLALCKDLIYSITEKFLQKGIKVVLDFGFWTQKEREEVKSRFKNFDCLFIYIDKKDEDIFENIEKRNANLKENEYYMDRVTYEVLASKFETPDEAEKVLAINNTNEEDVLPLIYSLLE